MRGNVVTKGKKMLPSFEYMLHVVKPRDRTWHSIPISESGPRTVRVRTWLHGNEWIGFIFVSLWVALGLLHGISAPIRLNEIRVHGITHTARILECDATRDGNRTEHPMVEFDPSRKGPNVALNPNGLLKGSG